jgi:high-affinity iron transporter
MLATFLIGLREGLEAALIVAILVAYVVKLDRRDLLPRLWIGVGAAIALSLGFALALQATQQSLSDRAQETFAGITSILAVCLITWMIFWMARNAKALRSHLHGKVDQAMAGGAWTLAAIAFLAVIREGLETALFLFAGVTTSGGSGGDVIGAVIGLAVAAGLGVVVYNGAVRINLAKLFLWTGVALIIIAAGVLSYGVHELQEVGILPNGAFFGDYAFDISGAIPKDGWLGSILRGTIGFTPKPTWLQLITWVAYLAIVLPLFLSIARSRSPQPAQAATSA